MRGEESDVRNSWHRSAVESFIEGGQSLASQKARWLIERSLEQSAGLITREWADYWRLGIRPEGPNLVAALCYHYDRTEPASKTSPVERGHRLSSRRAGS